MYQVVSSLTPCSLSCIDGDIEKDGDGDPGPWPWYPQNSKSQRETDKCGKEAIQETGCLFCVPLF